MSRYLHLSIYDEDRADIVFSALSSKLRRDILRMVDQSSFSTTEIAQNLNIPVSTAAFHINILKEADLVHVQNKPARHGVSKIISRKIDEINLSCTVPPGPVGCTSKTLFVPVGSFYDCEVTAPCGMATEERMIDRDDTPGVFYNLEKQDAQMVWFSGGYLEYRIPNYFLNQCKPIGLSVSAELCSEAPNFRNDWKSDITFWVNGIELCTWTSPGDFGGQRGKLNPPWWSDISTQYGLLKTVRVNGHGTYLDENKMSGVDISAIEIEKNNYFTLRIGVKPDAVNAGGMNIFGSKFGNYAQDITVRIDYQPEESNEE